MTKPLPFDLVRKVTGQVQRGEPIDLDETIEANDQALEYLRERLRVFHAKADKARSAGFYTKKELRELDEALAEGKELRKNLLALRKARDSSGALREVVAAEPMGIPPTPPLRENVDVMDGGGKFFLGIWKIGIPVNVTVEVSGQTTMKTNNGEEWVIENFDQELAKVSPAAAIAKALFLK